MKVTLQRSLHRPRGWVGVFFGGSQLALATVRGAGELANVEKETAAPVPAPGADGAVAPGWAAATQALRQQVDPREYHIVTAVGGEDVLCHTLRLPTTQPAELKQMLELQLDNLTPLPLEEVVYAFEPLETLETETRVLVAVARKAAVNERVAALEGAGLPATVVAVDALAVFHAVLKRGLLPRDEKLNTFVQLTPAVAHIIVHWRGQPVVVRSVARGGDQPERALREELQRTLVAAEAEQPGVALGRLSFSVWNEELRASAEELAAGWPEPAEFLANGATPSPALSLCLETAAPAAGGHLNLLPDEWRQRRRQARLRRTMIWGGVVAAVLYALAVAALLTLVWMQQSRVDTVDAQIKKRQKRYDAARSLHGELLAMQKQIDTKYSALETLREITVLMPPEGLKLSSFVFKKDQTITLRGQAATATAATDFISRLEKCPLFSNSKTLSVRTEAGGVTKFEILCTLKSATPPPAKGGPWP
jgi:Tfp pilus assembly PilM family ATPase